MLPFRKPYRIISFVIRPPHTAAGSVLRNECPRTMSGGEPSSIKRDQSCAARAPVTQLYTEDLFYPHERGNVVCIRRCTASGGPKPSPTWSGRSTSPKRCSGRSRRDGSRTPTFSPARAARAKPPAQRSSPRQSTASTPRTVTPATNARAASASSPAAFSM